MFFKAGYSFDQSVRSKINWLPSRAESNLYSECSTSELRSEEPPVTDSKAYVAVGDELVPLRLSVGTRPVWVFGLVSRVGLSRSKTAGPPLTRPIPGRTGLLFWPIKFSSERAGPAIRVYGLLVVPYCGLCDPSGLLSRCYHRRLSSHRAG